MFQPTQIVPSLPPYHIHLWKVHLNITDAEASQYFHTLSKDEQLRAERFRFAPLRKRYVAGRGILRALLGDYLNLRAKDLQFSYNAQGKPFLVNQPQSFFNVSNCQDWALIAIGQYEEMGVDIEFIDSNIECATIAPRFFSQREAKAVMDLPANQRPEVFFNCWTRKEAFIKAKGGGLSIPLDQFEVTLLPNEIPKLTDIQWSKGEAEEWGLRSFDVEDSFRGALAVRGRLDALSFYTYT